MIGTSLQSVDFVRSDGTPTHGLIPVDTAGISSLDINEQTAIFDAQLFQHIDFIFFRRFDDGRSAQVAAYIVDNSKERLTNDDLAELHLQVWLHGTAPLLYVSWPSRIDILTCARGPDFWTDEEQRTQYNPAETLDIAN